nr:hypothetical protein [Tanacetum cinerariifolium]
MKENNDVELNEKMHVQEAHFADPFEIYNLLNKKVIKEANQDDDPSHPPGFTPKDDDAKGEEEAGGILYVWDPNCFARDNATISDSFVAVRGTWIPSSTKLMIVFVYAPQDLSEKKSLWEYISHIIDSWDREYIILGDFNKVISEHERFGMIFNESSANAFNHFISTAGLIDLPLEGYSYTWAIKSASKMSKLDRGHNNKDLVNERTSLLKELHNIKKCHSLDIAQKAKVRWAIEGDKNSKFFHCIINKKMSQLAIRGVLIEGDWIDKPCNVKNEFFNHFSNRFAKTSGLNIELDGSIFKKLSAEQIIDLECDVTYDENKRAIWDCGTNKSPGGYWVLIKSNSLASKEKLIKHAGVSSWFSELGHANNLFVSDVRLVWTAIDGLPMFAWNKEAIAKIMFPWGALAAVDTVDDDSLPYRKFCVKKLEAWSPEFDDEFCDTSSIEESVENNDAELNEKVHVQEAHFADPFEIYNLLNKKVTKEANQDDDPSHPPGFTPKDDDAKGEEEAGNSVNQFAYSGNSLNNGGSRVQSGVNRSFSLKLRGSIMDVIENLVDIGQTMGPSVGFSGGILYVWDPNCFARDNATISDSFVAVRGTWIPSSTKLMIVFVYAPQDLSEKKSLWEYISHIIDSWDREYIILGDFNKVISEHERFGMIFNESSANAFNHFISTAGLIDLPLEGYSYTWAIKSASKMSKLD